jgi:Flp pilus assembly protein TadD
MQFGDAIKDLTKAIELQPDAADAYLLRAKACLGAGDYRSAWADVRVCQKLGKVVEQPFLDKLRKAMPPK